MSRKSRTDLAVVSAELDQAKAILKDWLRQKTKTPNGQVTIDRLQAQIAALQQAVSEVGDIEQTIVCELAKQGLDTLMLEIWTQMEEDDENE